MKHSFLNGDANVCASDQAPFLRILFSVCVCVMGFEIEILTSIRIRGSVLLH